MKNILAICAVVVAVIFAACGSRPKITYNIPENYPKERRAELIAGLNKGKELYKEHCSECHGIFTKGKDNIPNFTTTQLDNYTARFIMRDRKNHAAALKMPPDQLNMVTAFLRYKSTKIKDTTAAHTVPQ